VTFTVDTHHHMLPDFFWEATEGDDPVGGIAPPPWSRASALSFLDDAGIDVAITSISTPGVHTGGDAAARLLARRCNEPAAEMIRDRPGRFGGFACPPLPDVDGALAELAYALDDLQLDGVLLFSNARGVSRPIPAPTRSDCPTRLSTSPPIPPGPSPNCTTAAPSPAPPTSSTSSPAAEVPCPTWPGGSASSTRCASSPEPRSARPRRDIPPPVLGYRGVLGRPVLRMLRDVVGIDPVVFGTDYPYLRRDLAVSCREHIEATPELTDGERTAVLGATATTLIPRLATPRPRTRTPAS
jgi:hypothetical protein